MEPAVTHPAPPSRRAGAVVARPELPLPNSRIAIPRGSLSPPKTNNPVARMPESTPLRVKRPPTRLERTPGGSLGRSHGRPNILPRSLLPTIQRKSHEEIKLADSRSSKKDGDEDKFDITPDGGSAGREGRKFTVSNVGNNGRIYLRPTIRPAHQRYPQPNFVFPMSPPATATLDAATAASEREDLETDAALSHKQGRRSQWTLPPTPSTLAARKTFLSKRGRRRALSDSTIPDASVALESDSGAFKIVITQPGDESRPKSAENTPPGLPPVIEVDIPNWKLGTPRFTLLGTAAIRGSSLGAPTEEVLSSSMSAVANWTSRSQADSSKAKKLTPINIPRAYLTRLSAQGPGSPFSPDCLRPPRATYLSTHLVIQPRMFDDLTFKPACDDRSIVRYSPSTGAVTAATPPRLVAEITSPSFLDYELLSDFFLTFRSFLEPLDLLKMLIARLRWAVAREDETGMVVRVRTFVALRHWILNYFMDDFVVDYQLRVMFCNLLNDFSDELGRIDSSSKVQVRILGELKKCWRRVCAQYWDGSDFDSSLGPAAPIAPGGIVGHRDPELDPGFWQDDSERPPQLDAIFLSQGDDPAEPNSFYADVSRAGHVDSIMRGGDTSNAQETQQVKRSQPSPLSISSVDALSCSFPTKHLLFGPPGNGSSMAAHPANLAAFPMELTAATPKALTGKRVRPHQSQHKRSGSLTDSLRDHQPDEKVTFKNTEFLMTLPYAGSLVRGALFPPGQAFVELPTPGSNTTRQTTVFQPHPLDQEKEKGSASAMSSQGMRKLLGSVRRALSTRGQGVSPTQGNFINISPIGPRGATTNRLPGTAIVPQARPRLNGVRPPVRIDLLGAEVAEDFKKAVREDAALEAATNQGPPAPNIVGPMDEITKENHDQPSRPVESTIFQGTFLRPPSDTGVSTGSKSILIFDDTLPGNLPLMSGALHSPSMDSFVDSFLRSGADPTPPHTPPGQDIGTPRQDSYILRNTFMGNSYSDLMLSPAPTDALGLQYEHRARPSQDTTRPSMDASTRPSMDTIARPSMEAVGGPSRDAIPRPSVDNARPSVDSARQSSSRPPLSYLRGHTRQQSSKSHRTMQSFGRRRYASFTSGMTSHRPGESLDATTYSGRSVHDSMAAPVEPLRVLRRRPGGDLRAATNVGQLDHHQLRRSRSMTSLTTYSASARSSYLLSNGAQESSGFADVMTSDYSQERTAAFSLGAVTRQPAKKRASFFSTYSSKPIMRPSFEAEAKKLAQIPDDTDDDGGVESALAKLEGKFQKKKLKRTTEPKKSGPLSFLKLRGGGEGDVVAGEEKREHHHMHVGDVAGETGQHLSFVSLAPPPARHVESRGSFFSDGSGDSLSSVPILERGLEEDRRLSRTETVNWTGRSVLLDDDEEDLAPTPRGQNSQSFELVEKTRSVEQLNSGETNRQVSHGSFLLDPDSDDDSDLSSEMSLESANEPHEGDEIFVRKRSGTVGSRLPAHPLAERSVEDMDVRNIHPLKAHPPSPPMTLVQALQMSPETANVPQMTESQIWVSKPLPPTPDMTPTSAAHNQPAAEEPDVEAPAAKRQSAAARKFSVHLPFILAFDSEILAQQFTLIEKDALNEIDWKELIDMRWKNAATGSSFDARSWVDFLRNSDARGVEVVIARFNLMVKWCVSEVVLTQDVEERARCVIKLVHIAAHCRRFRNFATMSQIVIALTSPEVGKLQRTWAMVPARDLGTLRDLEALVSPTRNFYNLRAEMEGGGCGKNGQAETGCIPFVGIYTHDLVYNCQRPSEIASSPTSAPLVNFERCRCAAGIIKTLLRLLEASQLYDFQPIEGVTERCLWMGALSDEEIRSVSEGLE